MTEKQNVMRIGVRLPGTQPAVGWKSAIYDLDSGSCLPVTKMRLNVGPDSLITAEFTVVIDKLEIGEPE